MAKSPVSQVSQARLSSGRVTCEHLMSDAIGGMQMPVGTAQEGCVTQMSPYLSRDNSGFVLAVHIWRSPPLPCPGLGRTWVKNLTLIFS